MGMLSLRSDGDGMPIVGNAELDDGSSPDPVGREGCETTGSDCSEDPWRRACWWRGMALSMLCLKPQRRASVAVAKERMVVRPVKVMEARRVIFARFAHRLVSNKEVSCSSSTMHVNERV